MDLEVQEDIYDLRPLQMSAKYGLEVPPWNLHMSESLVS